MPELPEVETTRRGLEPHLLGCKVNAVRVFNNKLRWPVTPGLSVLLNELTLLALERRGKYLLFRFSGGSLLVHLGMSGSLRLVDNSEPLKKHDHVEVTFDRFVMRFNDPRRFGAVLWVEGDPSVHKLLASLGPEPLSEHFSGDYLFELSRKRTLPVKSFLMDSRVVVGVGNIYANEALFATGIHPLKPAGKITRKRYTLLAEAVVTVLCNAIGSGGSTLRDFVNPQGKPGYFQQTLKVYGRAGLPCVVCGRLLKDVRVAQRTSVFCPSCQK
ncbi:MAG: bifunctional DNA-formamidopyrimidine glycosylase/DNA-(apurinic or apyrimidinic site) lyase [Pseudomonadales bacterium]|nr:bifunctional DNA-formamidopyrimidine glycosylase/DNA-(apurinic or apyrimidinic site) lyase [Pseudomonadales bacterium]